LSVGEGSGGKWECFFLRRGCREDVFFGFRVGGVDGGMTTRGGARCTYLAHGRCDCSWADVRARGEARGAAPQTCDIAGGSGDVAKGGRSVAPARHFCFWFFWQGRSEKVCVALAAALSRWMWCTAGASVPPSYEGSFPSNRASQSVEKSYRRGVGARFDKKTKRRGGM
jgi:hypothetical protein